MERQVYGTASMRLLDCSFSNNRAVGGGAIYNLAAGSGAASPIIRDCIFSNNTATIEGGCIYNESVSGGDASPNIRDCQFMNNTATFSGGVIYNLATGSSSFGRVNPEIINCIFGGNTADEGGAIYSIKQQSNTLQVRTAIINCTFFNNTASSTGGAIFNNRNQPSIRNCIFWENQQNGASNVAGADIFNLNNATPFISNCLTQENSIYSTGSGIINNLNPRFVDTANQNFRLFICSPAINSGANNVVNGAINNDIVGNPRIFDGRVDMGAYENQNIAANANLIYVNQNVVGGTNDGLSWANAFTNLQDALDLAQTCSINEIWVAQGTYIPSIDNPSNSSTNARDVTFYINTDGIKIYGGFSGNGTETSLSERNVAASPTVLSGDLSNNDGFDLSGTALLNDASRSDNAFSVVYIDGTTSKGIITNATLIDGFIISDGNGNNSDGSGIYLNGSSSGNEASPTIRNCTFISNSAIDGGGIYADGSQSSGDSNPIVDNCSFINNAALNRGGGIYFDGSDGGLSTMDISECTFKNNFAMLDGSAIHITAAGSGFIGGTVVNSVFQSNGVDHISIDDGNDRQTLAFTNCTFEGASNRAISIVTVGGSQQPFQFNNCIFWNNTALTNSAVSLTPTFSIVGDDTNNDFTGGNNFNQDPLFVDADEGDLNIQICSPAIDAGNNTFIGGISTDINSNPRIVNSTVDIGAFENQNTSANPITLYVNQSVLGGLGDGSSWANALTDLQDALDLVSSCNVAQIWVAEGTYVPSADNPASNDNTSRDATFYINTDGIKIYGGFSGDGTETTLADRDIPANPTILSGDIGTLNVNTDNIYHVLFIDGTTTNGSITNATILDGLIIQDGNANGAASNFANNGGGIYANGRGSGSECSPTISNCQLLANNAVFGGAIFNDAFNFGIASMQIRNCTFSNNTASSGAAIYNYTETVGIASPMITDCVFSDNSVSNSGGGIYNLADDSGIASPSIINCQFINNSAASEGGAMYNRALLNGATSASPSITNSIFSGNSAFVGGAVANFEEDRGASASPITQPTFTNCTFYNNIASGLGGAIANDGARPSVRNSIFWENEQSNNASVAGADIYESNSSNTPIVNSLTQANSIYSSGTGIINAQDPLFIDASEGDLSLEICSPAIDAGNNSFIGSTTTDLVGNPRIVNSTVDMGAFENQNTSPLSTIIYVNQNAMGGAGDGLSWATAFRGLQAALNLARACNINKIWVAAGTYVPSADNPASNDNTSRDVTFYINTDGIKIYGGFSGDGTETTLADRDIPANPTILSGDIGTLNVNTDNIYHVLFIDGTTTNGSITNATILDGLTIQSGNANGLASNLADSGGGIYINGSGLGNESSPNITNCTFRSNVAITGGVILNNANNFGIASMSLSDCTFTNNRAAFGGVMYNFTAIGGNASPNIVNCLFSSNTATSSGGAFYNDGIDSGTSSPTIINSVFSNNTAFSEGGSMVNVGVSNGTINTTAINCTFYGNSAGFNGGAIANDDAEPIFHNCIFWDNLQNGADNVAGADIAESNGSASDVKNCLTQTNSTYSSGTGIINAQDPLFIDAFEGDLSLEICSPAIDAGNNSFIGSTITDLVGNPRIVNSTVDIGAFERQDFTLPNSLTISSITSTDSLFTGADTVQTIGTITVAAMETIIFEATETVILKAGFSAVAGSNFTARIGQCGVPASNNIFAPEIVEQRSEPTAQQVESVENKVFTEQYSSLTAYPNPFRGNTTIEFELGSASNVQLSIFDLQGRVVKQVYQGTWLNAGQHQVEVEVMDWQAGIYLVRLQTEQEVITKQLILQR